MPLAHSENKKYTYADYLAWPQDDRWELIDGVPYGKPDYYNNDDVLTSTLLEGFSLPVQELWK